MFVVSGATGHTGSVVASTLLQRGQKVRLIVRDQKKGEAWRARGAEVALAALDDAAALQAALRGADGVYVLVPPDFSDDPAAAQARVVDAWARAFAAARPKHVVLLSSVGAQHAAGTGPIGTVHLAEQRLGDVAPHATFVRASYFMENWGGMVAPAKQQGILPSMLAPGRAVPMVATADIGRVAAEALLDGAGAPRVIEFAGPRDYTPEEVAAAFGRALGREVRLVPVPDAAIEEALRGAGLPPKLAALFREMIGGINRGHVAAAGPLTRGRVALDEVIKSLVG